MWTVQAVIYVVVFLSTTTHAFYLPGLAPVNYCKKPKQTEATLGCKTDVPLFVNRLNTEETEVPYEYHYFDFCTTDETSSPVENLGQILFGERIRPSPYKISFLESTQCQKLCTKSYLPNDKDSIAKLNRLKDGIRLNYQHHWIIDNLPVLQCFHSRLAINAEGVVCSRGFPMGCYSSTKETMSDGCTDFLRRIPGLRAGEYYLFNHVDLTITYHSGEHEEWGSNFQGLGGRIISIKATPRSINHNQYPSNLNCSAAMELNPLSIPDGELKSPLDITYSFSVEFKRNDTVKWSSRWDYILETPAQTNAQWFTIFNSIMIVFFLTGMVAMIILRTLHKDIARYNQIDVGEDVQEEFGWKLVHGDVFRPPRRGMLLSVFLGSGVQVFSMTVVTLIFACLGFLSPANRGSLMTCALTLYVFSGISAGYVSARIYKSFGGEKWKTNILLTASLCPGIVFLVFFLLNLLLWTKGSSAAVPFFTLLALISLWSCISLPLTFLGAVLGFRKRAIEHPVRTNQIPRQIPEQTAYTQLVPGLIMGGVLPFCCIFVQMYFILNSIWSNQMYYMFGLLFLVFLILIITCSETTILLCYFHLCAEDYNWWWRSFLTSGFTAVYLFLYCVHYFNVKLHVDDAASFFIYFGYTLVAVFLFFLMTGCMGFFACFWFIRKIYSVVKVD